VEGSKRYVTADQAKSIVEAVRNFGERDARVEIPSLSDASSASPVAALIRKARALENACRRPLVVGVFQNADVEDIEAVSQDVGLDLVQLHGDEGMGACSKCGVPAIRVVHIEATTEKIVASDSAEKIVALLTADPLAILLDTSVQGVQGGTGATFDWDVAKAIQNLGLPVIVAGGLNAENIEEVVSDVKPWGVDVSSGVEASPGRKDVKEVQAFVSSARKAAEEASKGF